jgi:hypothetical protein|mmetsp:Transcript_6975/g.9223  ORF Transcript_6975/g.9223 Transcript_6975/m.9223 type:complete len:141 (-) Transcript_6975:182-604(-)
MSAQIKRDLPQEPGHMTVRIPATPDQTWALDADYLHGRLDVLKSLGSHYANRIFLLDMVSDLMLLGGILTTFFVAWWTLFPMIGLACLQKISNRRMAGELAGRAAQESTDAFLYLYNSGVLWLERPTSPSSDRLRQLLLR